MTTEKYTLTEKNELKLFANVQNECYRLSKLSRAPGVGFCVTDAEARWVGSEKRRRNVEGEVVRDTESVSS